MFERDIKIHSLEWPEYSLECKALKDAKDEVVGEKKRLFILPWMKWMMRGALPFSGSKGKISLALKDP